MKDLRQLIWRICGYLSGGSVATYLNDLWPLIWRIYGHLSGGYAATYLLNCENKAKSAQMELELGLSLAIPKDLFYNNGWDTFGELIQEIQKQISQNLIGPPYAILMICYRNLSYYLGARQLISNPAASKFMASMYLHINNQLWKYLSPDGKVIFKMLIKLMFLIMNKFLVWAKCICRK